MWKLIALREYLDQQAPGLAFNPRRLQAALYLADWRHTIEEGTPITSVAWAFHHHGTMLTPKQAASRPSPAVHRWLAPLLAPLTTTERQAADHVIASLSGKSSAWLDHLVTSTYPAITQACGSPLDLPRLAEAYRSLRTAAPVST